MKFFNQFTGKLRFGIFEIAPGMSAAKTKRRYAAYIRSSPDGEIELRHDNHHLRLLFQKNELAEVQLNWLYEDGTFYQDDDFYDLHLALHLAKVPRIWWNMSSGPDYWVLCPSGWARLRRVALSGGIPFIVLLLACLYPINNGMTRCLILLCLLWLWGGGIKYLLLYRKYLGMTALALSLALFGAVAFCPLKEIPRDKLNRLYLKQLRSYENTRYVWGGENRSGIDCSGLPRAAFRYAQETLGINTLNFGLIRSSLENWWFDASARALAAGYRHYLQPLQLGGTVGAAPEASLLPGDLAITDDGVHVMVFLGDGEWISADPGQGRVIIEDRQQSRNPWFAAPVHFYRWSQFCD